MLVAALPKGFLAAALPCRCRCASDPCAPAPTQLSFFFGYMAMVCFGFFIMLGTVGWRASLVFVRHIYKAIKSE